MEETAQIGCALKKNGEKADNDSILLEGIHNNNKT